MPVNTNNSSPKDQLVSALITEHLLVKQLITIVMDNYHILKNGLFGLQKSMSNPMVSNIGQKLIQECEVEIINELKSRINDWVKAIYHHKLNENIIPISYPYIMQQGLSLMVKDADLAKQFTHFPINELKNGKVLIKPIDELIDETIGLEYQLGHLNGNYKKIENQ